MPRAIWSGTVGFGLVQIPVTVHGGEERDELSFTLLDRRDFSPIGYQRVNKRTGAKVPPNEIVKGLDQGDGNYVVLSEADFERANIEATRQMDIAAFVDFAAIDPRYIERPYYLAPQKSGRKAYALLRETLKRTGKAGIGKVVLKTRQHLGAIVAREKALILVLLRFADELRDESDLDLPDTASNKLGITPKELSMAEKLVAGMTEEFKPEEYRDEYRDDLQKLIRAKVKAGEVNRVPDHSEAKPPKPLAGARIIDLAALLSQSVSGRHKRADRALEPARVRNSTHRKPGPAKAGAKRHNGAATHRKSA